MGASKLGFPRRGVLTGAALAAALAVGVSAQAAVLEQVAPAAVTYVPSVDYNLLTGTGTGDVTALVQVVDVSLGLGNFTTSGCQAADFAGFAAGSIALLQRGTCTFAMKAANAQAAGALAVLIFNQGNTADPSRQDAFLGTLAATFTLPVLALSYDLGALLANTPGLQMHVVVTDADVAALMPSPGTLTLAALGLGLIGLGRRPRNAG
jgi:Zn-dependent M28 family amino/carboxypeptidase